jgi:Na+/melibiose symporter-like transporter
VEPVLSKKILIGYLYFVQGLVLVLCGTLPLTYKTLPSYTILGYFSAATLPFSFKFITGSLSTILAPLIEKYTNLSYGRRKFWIVISMTVASLVIFLISFIADDESKQIPTAALLFVMTLCVSVQDISTDALGVKELRKPELSSFLQSVFQQLGIVAGSLLLGELTS